MLDSLLDKFKKEFAYTKRSVLKNVMVLTICMLDGQTVNLNKLKIKVGQALANTQSKPSSHYKRLIRLFTNQQESSLWHDILLFCVKMFRLKVDYLLLDGTSWEFWHKKDTFIGPIYDLQRGSHSSPRLMVHIYGLTYKKRVLLR